MKLVSRAVIRLITVSYDAQSPARQAELQECLHRNLANPHLGQVLVWKHSGKTPIAQPGLESKLALLERNHSPTFDDLFALANAVCDRDDVAVIANSDVWFDDTAALIDSIRPNQFFALLRWEADGKMYSAHDGGPRPDSQDAWIFRTPIRPVGAPFGLGLPRNDNALAYRLSKLDYDLRNPAKSIRIHHRHASAVRPFAASKFFIPPPWLHLEATELHERGATKLTRKTFSPRWQFHRLREYFFNTVPSRQVASLLGRPYPLSPRWGRSCPHVLPAETSTMSASPLISIIIPAFNAASVIAETLESVRQQTFEDYEVIIVDDGSTDETAAIGRRFCDSDPRFHLLRQHNQGTAAARNAGINQSRGEWIAFLDADDVWLPEKLACQMALAQAMPRANFLFTNFYLWDGERDLNVWFHAAQWLPEGDVSRKLVYNVSYVCAASMSTAMVRRDTLLEIGLFDPKLATSEDWDLLLRLAERGLWVHGTRRPLVRYRRWSGNITNQKTAILKSNLRVLEKNAHTSRRLELHWHYRASLAETRSNLELAQARQLIETAPDKLPAAIFRAWKLTPLRLRWLCRYWGLRLPDALGGTLARAYVHRKLIQKW